MVLRADVARSLAWSALVAALVLADRVTAAASPPARMLALVAAAALGLKAVVAAEERAMGAPRPRGAWWLAFLLAWPGARPSLFAVRRRRADAVAPLRDGLRWLLLGLAVRVLAPRGIAGDVVRLVSLSLVVHFGLLGLLTALWRRCGVPCPVLFAAPWRATSLREFWGRRWNRAFSEAAALAIDRPLRVHVGPTAASALVFVFSGLLHEAVISLPVRAGFGGPTLYFVIQAALVEIERRGWLRIAGWHGRLRTWLCLALPLPLLFQPAFVHDALGLWMTP